MTDGIGKWPEEPAVRGASSMCGVNNWYEGWVLVSVTIVVLVFRNVPTCIVK